jgi:hypothetical protein
MLRLAYGGEPPRLLPDEFLSVRSVHPDQKTYEMTNSWPEIDRFVEIFSPQLSRGERLRKHTAFVIGPAGGRARRAGSWFRGRIVQSVIHYVIGPLRRRVWTPWLTWCGDQLERVPERWRPPIRTRDRMQRPVPRRRRTKRVMDDRYWSLPGPPRSPIGLEPADVDDQPEHPPPWPRAATPS